MFVKGAFKCKVYDLFLYLFSFNYLKKVYTQKYIQNKDFRLFLMPTLWPHYVLPLNETP